MQTLTEKNNGLYSLILRLALVFIFLFKSLNSDSLVCGTDLLVHVCLEREGKAFLI